jgi:dATP/dGTP diphosphohydrolase
MRSLNEIRGHRERLEREVGQLLDEEKQAEAAAAMPLHPAQVLAAGLDQEVRVKDPVSGGEKGVKLARFDLIPPAALEELACVYGRGAQKYAANNWRKGYAWGLSVGALQRHLSKWLQGGERDEMGNHHMIQVAWHAFCLYTFQRFGLGTDDRQEANNHE